jgi:hypothetical protein
MREQIAILAKDHGEWIFVIDSDEDEPERAWKSCDTAIKELGRDGWEVIEGPGPIRATFPELEDLNRFASWGYKLRWAIH